MKYFYQNGSMAKISLFLILLILGVIRTGCVVQNSESNGRKLQNDHILSKSSDDDSLDLLQNIKLINEISMDDILGPPVRPKRSPKGGSVVRRRQARRNTALWKYEDADKTHGQTLDRSQPDKRDVSRPFRRNRKTMSENGERKRSMFLANLLFAQTEKMPQPLDTLFSDNLL